MHDLDLELILPTMNRENDIRSLLTHAAEGLLELAVPAAIAVVDGGSSDRTLEAVDAVAATCMLPIRTVGCSQPGWSAAALRGITTSGARWVGLGEPAAFGNAAAVLRHAVRLLASGIHIVCVAEHGPQATVLDAAVAELVVGEQLPVGPDFAPQLLDTARHAGLRMTAYGRVARAVRVDVETTVALQRVNA